MASVVIYSSGSCPFCVQAKQFLEGKGVAIEEVRIDLDDAKRDEMLQKSNGKRTVPQIFINDFHVGGFDDLQNLNREGKLDELLSS